MAGAGFGPRSTNFNLPINPRDQLIPGSPGFEKESGCQVSTSLLKSLRLYLLTIHMYKSINRPNMSKMNPAFVFEANAKRLPTSGFSVVGVVGLRWLIGKT